ncbi:MAG: hypothetical protein FJW40_13545 [Acidobacteria bacterium]|nr:hypothetical protein [Acidobacteriota bacterium]
MAAKELYHGADAEKMLFNLRNGSITANPSGQIFFAEHQWQGCFMHGADTKTGESYAGRFLVEIPQGAALSRQQKSGNPDAVILTLAPGGAVRAQLLELFIRL